MRKSLPSKKKILEYWIKEDPYLVKRQSSEYEYHCFCCGRSGVERAHIIPHCQGGSEDVSNLHLLCTSCHFITENTKKMYDQSFYNFYIRNTDHWLVPLQKIIHKWGTNELHTCQS